MTELEEITQAELLELFAYNPDTGILTNRTSRTSNSRAGEEAGSDAKSPRGAIYRKLSINNKMYLVHRVIWCMVYGCFPEQDIDHINHITSDNRLSNLRAVSREENAKNQGLHPSNTSGHNGVSWRADGEKWVAYTTVNYKRIWLGMYETYEEAVSARKAADVKYGYHDNHGKCVYTNEQPLKK